MSTMLDQYLTDLVECEDHYSRNKVCEIEKENTFFFVKKKLLLFDLRQEKLNYNKFDTNS